MVAMVAARILIRFNIDLYGLLACVIGEF